MRRPVCKKKGTSEHPEELTDRCCLSALAGLSKYLPFFGAAGIIPIRRYMSTARNPALWNSDLMFIKEEEKPPF